MPAAANGDISAYVTDATDLVVDINGYFAPEVPGAQSLYTTAPCRVLDTRPNAFNGQIPINVASGPCGIPSAAQAYVLNATVVPQTKLGFLTLWPDGVSRPLVSTLNAVDGKITSNMAMVPTSNGSIDAFGTNPTNLVLDLSGYFGP